MNKIKCSPVFSFSDRLKYLEVFNADVDIWIVSDLVLKKRIKALLLKDNVCTHSGSIVRAQEFWQFLFKRLYPEFTIKADSLIIAMLKHFLSKNNLEGFGNENYVKNLFLHISSFLPIFTSLNAVDHFSEWLKKNPDPHLESWFFLSFKSWKYLLGKKIVSISFLPGILSSDRSDLFSFLKGKKITFDLGFQMQALEVACIKNLSEVTEVKVLKPTFHNSNRADTFLWTYKLLEDVSLYQTHLKQSDKKNLPSSNSQLEDFKGISFVKYSNQLAEIRGIVAEIKNFLQLGVSLNNIAIVAPDIEYLWPILSLQLSKEGVPVNKAVVFSLNSNKIVMFWLARLRVTLGSTSYSDLEMVFASEGGGHISYKELKYYFSNTYSIDNYQKTLWSKKLLEKPINKNTEIHLLEFLDWAFSFWKFDKWARHLLTHLGGENLHKEKGIIDTVWQQVYQALREAGETSVKLSMDSWLLYVEDVLSKKTYTFSKEVSNAVSCYNISNSDNLEEKYIILSDLSFDSLKSKKASAVSFSQALSLSEDLGISLDPNWGSQLEGILKYIFQLKNKVILCSWSMTNLESKEQVASAFFLEEYFNRNNTSLPLTNIYPSPFNKGDLSQITYKKKLEKINTNAIDLKSARALYDKNILPMQEVRSALPSISVTNIGRYIECPFVFFSEKILKLENLPDWDLDIDVLNKGSLFHKLLELIITENIVESDDMVLLFSQLNAYRKKELKVDDSAWIVLKEQLKSIAKNFIDLEKKQKLISPKLKMDFVEYPLQAFWSRDKKRFLLNESNGVMQKQEEGLLVKGKVDRLDSDERGIVIRDYKTSVNSRVGVKKWKEKKDLSLFLYYKLWKANGHEKDFLGAFYLGINDLKSKGVWVSENKESGFENFPTQSIINKEETLKLFSELDKELESLMEGIFNGKFFPNPKKKDTRNKTCNKCKWSGLCRIAGSF